MVSIYLNLYFFFGGGAVCNNPNKYHVEEILWVSGISDIKLTGYKQTKFPGSIRISPGHQSYTIPMLLKSNEFNLIKINNYVMCDILLSPQHFNLFMHGYNRSSFISKLTCSPICPLFEGGSSGLRTKVHGH